MSIIWKYLDKRSAVVDALKDYNSMKFIIEHTDDEIRAAYEKMGGVSSPQSDGMPYTRNPHAVEDRMVKGIEEIDVLKERYRQAMEYMAWFLPAWEELSEDERYVLETFYSDSESQTNAGRNHAIYSTAWRYLSLSTSISSMPFIILSSTAWGFCVRGIPSDCGLLTPPIFSYAAFISSSVCSMMNFMLL